MLWLNKINPSNYLLLAITMIKDENTIKPFFKGHLNIPDEVSILCTCMYMADVPSLQLLSYMEYVIFSERCLPLSVRMSAPPSVP